MYRNSRSVRVTTSSLILQSMDISTSTACWERKKNIKPLQPICMSNVDGTFGTLQGIISKTNNHYNIIQRIRADPTLKLYNQLPFQQSTVRLGIFQNKTSTTNIHFNYLLHVGRLQDKDYTTYTHFNNLRWE